MLEKDLLIHLGSASGSLFTGLDLLHCSANFRIPLMSTVFAHFGHNPEGTPQLCLATGKASKPVTI